MELSNLQLIEVKTRDNDEPQLQVLMKVENNLVSCGELHRKVCDTLCLKIGSRELFSLFVNKQKKKKKVKLNEFLRLPVTDITIEKWCFDKDSEKKVLQSDNSAVHLIFMQAQQDLHSGKLRPSNEQAQALEACLDPHFCTKKQYIEICQTIEGYFSFQLDSCTLITGINLQSQQMRPGSVVCVCLSKAGIQFLSEYPLSVPWFNVHSWSICPHEAKVTFNLNVSMETALTITIETSQAMLLITAVMEFLKILLKSNSELPPFHSSMIKTSPDGSTTWENSFFGIHM